MLSRAPGLKEEMLNPGQEKSQEVVEKLRGGIPSFLCQHIKEDLELEKEIKKFSIVR